MDALYILFPDAREGEDSVAEVNAAIGAHNSASRRRGYQSRFLPVGYQTPVRAWQSHGSGMAPDGMLDILRRIDWRHPALLVYRTGGENRWSHLMVGLSLPDLVIGEGA